MVDKRVEQNLRTSQMEDDVINVDFLDWLKKWGPNIIIAVALAVIIFQGSQWWIRQNEDRRSMAWADLTNSDTVAGLLAVADENRSIGSVAELAWLKAAELHYQTILSDKPIEIDALSSTTNQDNSDSDTASEDNAEKEKDDKAEKDKTEKPTHLSPQDRTDLLDKMQTMYQNVIESTKDSPQKVLLHIRAVFGMATVAEMKLDYDSATSWYEKALSITDKNYPKLTALALARMEDMKKQDKPLKILTDEEFRKLKEARRTPDLLQLPTPQPQTTQTPDAPDANEKSKGDNAQQPEQDSAKDNNSEINTEKSDGGSGK